MQYSVYSHADKDQKVLEVLEKCVCVCVYLMVSSKHSGLSF